MGGRIILLQSIVPREPYHQFLDTTMFASQNPASLTFINRMLMVGYTEMVSRDNLLWAKKKYISRPLVVKGDGPISHFRRHFQQFYSENSPTWESIQEEKQRLH